MELGAKVQTARMVGGLNWSLISKVRLGAYARGACFALQGREKCIHMCMCMYILVCMYTEKLKMFARAHTWSVTPTRTRTHARNLQVVCMHGVDITFIYLCIQGSHGS